MRKTLWLFALLFILSTPSHALNIDEVKTKLRPLVEKYLGDELAIKIFGKKANTITIPSIPKIEENAKDVENLIHNDPNANIIPEDKKAKFYYSYVSELYSAVRKTDPNENDLIRWLNAMEQGATHEGVYRGMVLDPIYRGLENYENTLTNPVKKFVISYYDKFLGLAVNEESLVDVNFYYMKKETVEKSLEVADAFIIRDRSDLYRWYAVFSAQIAKEYPNVFDSKIRNNQSEQFHFEWASRVSFQLIKAEIIVKLHKVFNYLMP